MGQWNVRLMTIVNGTSDGSEKYTGTMITNDKKTGISAMKIRLANGDFNKSFFTSILKKMMLTGIISAKNPRTLMHQTRGVKKYPATLKDSQNNAPKIGK